MNKNQKELISKIGIKHDLGWDYQKMTTSGRETYQELCLAFGWQFEWNEEEA